MLLHSEAEARAFVAARCPPKSLSSLERFAELLRRENSTQNLIAASTLDSLWLRHIADSAQLLDHVSRETQPWVDLGAGAGFPGLVIAAMDPAREVVLIESRSLRIQWLRRVIGALDLQRCRVVGSDIRKADTFEAGVISARAFAPLPRLVEVSARFSTNATEWVLPKGRSAAQDIAQLPDELKARFHVKQSVTDADAGIVLARGQFKGAIS